jgi:hypothetical protein
MKSIFAVTVLLLALGLAGTDDFEQAQLAHKSLCAHMPKKEFCK